METLLEACFVDDLQVHYFLEKMAREMRWKIHKQTYAKQPCIHSSKEILNAELGSELDDAQRDTPKKQHGTMTAS